MKTMKNFTKNILGGMLLTSTLGVMSACDPLGVEPTSQVEESQFWSNPQLARAYVNNFYFIGESNSGNTFQSEQWSDNCLGNLQTNWADYRQYTFYRRDYDENSSPDIGPWSGSYRNIRNIYVAIDKIGASGLDEDLKNQMLGECHFFLAYVYFDMIKFWGAVPYVDKALNLGDDTFLPQSKREVIFDNILANLDKSVEYFNNSTRTGEMGMINKNVVNAFISRVALYAANAAEASAKNLYADDAAGLFKFEKGASTYYQKAYSAANAVSGYSLEENYEDLFTSTDAHLSTESIWPVMFKKDQRNGFNPTAKNGPNEDYYTSNSDLKLDWEMRGGTFPTQDLVDCYLMKDEATGKWMNWWETSQMQALGVTKNADGEITGSGEDYRKMFENRDERFYATITYDGSYLGLEGDERYLIQTWIDDTEPKRTLKFSSLHTGMRYVEDVDIAPTGYGSEQTITGYYLRKYSHLNEFNDDGTLNKEQKTTCYFNIRYAEVLLNKAEAAIKLNKESEALALVNQIRNRAGLDNYSGNDLWNEYKTQRRLEFAFECPGHRYFDLLRWGESEGKSVIEELNTGSRGLWISRKGVEINEYGVGKLGYPVEPGGEGYEVPSFKTFKVDNLSEYYERKFDHYRFYFIPFNKTTFAGYDEIQQNPGWTNYIYSND